MMTIDPTKYGELCANAVPKVIESIEEFNRMVATMEEIDRKKEAATPEERVLADLLGKLVMDYDDKMHPDPEIPPHEMIQYLMEQRKLRQVDLVPILGSRAQVSDIVGGRRGVSKAQAKKLAEFFHKPVDFFI